MFTSLRQSFGLSPTKQQELHAEQSSSSRLSPSKSQQTPRRMLEPSVWGRLHVESRKGKATSTYPITERECTIGRSGDNDVRLCEIGVSRHACRIRFVKPGQAYLEILGSNKIYINEEGMSPSSDPDAPAVIALSSDDVLMIQKYRFRFQYEETSEGAEDPVYVAMSPASRGRPSLQPLATPGGQRRKVRMSLVRVADVDTPRKNRGTDSPIRRVETSSRASIDGRRPPSTIEMAVSTRPQKTPTKNGNGSWQTEELVSHEQHVSASDDDEMDADDDDDEAPIVSQEIVVVDEPAEDAEEFAPSEDKENHSLPMKPTQTESPRSDSPRKREKRRSSFLGRAWPFSGSSLGFYAEEREPLPQEAPELASESTSSALPAEEAAEEDEEDDYLAPLGGESPRMPRSLSSPGRLGSSPSFHLSSRRKVSLRTKTLLKSSAALAERLTAQAEADYDESPSDSASNSLMASPTMGPRMSPMLSEISSLQLRDGEPSEEQHEAEGDDEDEIDKSLGVIEVLQDDDIREGFEVPEEAREEVVESEPTPEVVEEQEEEEEATPLPDLATFDVPSVRSSAASKRLSMPAFLGRRSFFGLLPKIRSSNEAEDIASKLDQLRHIETPGMSREPSTAGTDVSAASQQSTLSPAASEALKGPARDALRYLLSHKSKSPSISQAPVMPDPAPAGSGLRTLMLGRPDDASLLEQTKKSKRGSLILAPQHPVATALRAGRDSSTPDFTFLRQVFRLSIEDTETDAQLKSLRLFFQEWEDIIHEDSDCSDEDFEALVDLMASPAAQRILVAAAGSITRLSSAPESAGLDHEVREAYMRQAAMVHEAPVVPAPRPPARTSGRCSGGLVVEKDGDNIITYRKTRRGCRGGKRRSKSLSPAVEEGGDSIAAFLAAASTAESEVGTQMSHESIPEVIPEVEEEHHAADDSEALITAVRAEQESLAQAVPEALAASSPMATPSRPQRAAAQSSLRGSATTAPRSHRRTATATGLEREVAEEPKSVASSPSKARGKAQSRHKRQATSQYAADLTGLIAHGSHDTVDEAASPSKSRSRQVKEESLAPSSPVKSRAAASKKATNGTHASKYAVEPESNDEPAEQPEAEAAQGRRGRKAPVSAAQKPVRSRRGGKTDAAQDEDDEIETVEERHSRREVSSSPVKSRSIRGAAARAQQAMTSHEPSVQETQSSPVKSTRGSRRDAATNKDVPEAPSAPAARATRGRKNTGTIMSEPVQAPEAAAEAEPSPAATRTRSGRVLRKRI